MTRANALGAGGSVSESRTPTERRKATLVCPRCGHESHIDGDWIVTIHEDTYNLSCPDCRTRLTTRWLRD